MDALFLLMTWLTLCHSSSATPAHGFDRRSSSTCNDSLIGVETLLDPLPYFFPNEAAENTPSLFPMQPCNGVVLEEATIDDLQGNLTSGVFTTLELTQCYLARGLQVNGYVNTMIQQNPDWALIAAALDAERAAGKVRGPLHGIPFFVKDNIASKDKMETTAGSWALVGSIVPRDAFVVKQLREAGALLLGKATLSEWADMRSNNYSEGYSGRGGQARSAYNLTENPYGSSSGSASAVAANVVPFALGTETDGSVIAPADRNAVVGIKPTVGLTSRNGVIPESIHQDTVGCFGKTVKDATYVLDAIFGVDSRDNYTSAQIGKTPDGGYTQFLSDYSVLANATFGIPWESFWVYADDEQQAQLIEVMNLMASAGATIINGTELPNYETIIGPYWDWDWGTSRGYPNESEYSYVKVDFYNNIATYLSELNNTNIRSVEDIVAYNYANDGTEGGNPWPLGIPAFYSGQDGLLASLESKGIMNETYWQALSFCQKATREDGIDAALYNNGTKLDALIVPPDVAQTYQIAAQAGYPMITVPVTTHSFNGMPYGIGLMVSAWQEDILIKYGSAIEDLNTKKSGGRFGRTKPNWYSYLSRNIPVLA